MISNMDQEGSKDCGGGLPNVNLTALADRETAVGLLQSAKPFPAKVDRKLLSVKSLHMEVVIHEQ